MRKRDDFLKAARARRASKASLVLQARQRGDVEALADAVRVGFTCSKKVGNAVARNRAKRRLRAAARAVLPTRGCAGWDYVLIGRAGTTASRPFPLLLQDLQQALERIHHDAPKRAHTPFPLERT
jgi:ribonuclease P protein component